MKHEIKLEKSLAAPDPMVLSKVTPFDAEIVSIYNRFGRRLEQGAQEMNISSACLAAIIHVVSGGRLEDDHGRMIVSFSAERFFHFWGRKNEDAFYRSFRFKRGTRAWFSEKYRPLGSKAFKSYHGDSGKEREAFDLASRLSKRDAIKSLNMGVGQIMGCNYSLAGFENVFDMNKAMKRSAKSQLDGLCKYVWRRAGAIFNLETEDLVPFCRVYFEGPEVKKLASKMRRAMRAYRRLTRGRKFEAAAMRKSAHSQIGKKH